MHWDAYCRGEENCKSERCVPSSTPSQPAESGKGPACLIRPQPAIPLLAPGVLLYELCHIEKYRGLGNTNIMDPTLWLKTMDTM